MTPFFHGLRDEILKLASDRFGVKLIGEWTSQEKAALSAILEQLPEKLVRGNGNLRAIARAPKVQNAPPDAPGHSMYRPNNAKQGKYRGTLVIFDKGVYDRHGKLDAELFGKSVLHELSHSFSVKIPSVFGRPPYITEYAAQSNKEDWAESFAEFFLHPEALKSKAPEKSEAIAKFLGGQS